jgi:CHASE2 domain-containing sensor protein
MPFQIRRRRIIIFDALLAGIIAVVLVGACEWFENHTEAGQRIEFITYDIIQSILASKPIPKKIPIAIVDLGELRQERIMGAKKGEAATPRKELKPVIEKLANLGAKAIGVDVDFSPNNRVFITPADSDFFKWCLGQRVPIYLGIKRTQALRREEWLLKPEYQNLAASIVAPRTKTQDMLQCFQLHGESKCAPTLSEALAGHLPDASRPFYPSWFERISKRKLSNNIYVGVFPVDYSALENFMTRDHTISSIKPEVLEANADLIKRSVVLVGDASEEASDKVSVPARLDPVPGIYIHASAIYTLSQAPLYRFTPHARRVVDTVLATVMIVPLMLLRLYYNKRTTAEVARHRVEGALILIIVLTVLVVGALLVYHTRLLWDDFLLVILTFVMHPKCERYVKNIGSWLGRVVPVAWHNFIFGPERKQH